MRIDVTGCHRPCVFLSRIMGQSLRGYGEGQLRNYIVRGYASGLRQEPITLSGVWARPKIRDIVADLQAAGVPLTVESWEAPHARPSEVRRNLPSHLHPGETLTIAELKKRVGVVTDSTLRRAVTSLVLAGVLVREMRLGGDGGTSSRVRLSA